jgi:hypothetical protein
VDRADFADNALRELITRIFSRVGYFFRVHRAHEPAREPSSFGILRSIPVAVLPARTA